MKKRRLAIIAFILCACLVMGIGYAALSRTLRADGIVTLSSDVDNFPVIFTQATIAPGATNTNASAENVSATIDSNDAAIVNVTIANGVLSEVGDTVELTLKVENRATLLKAEILTPHVITNELSDYVAITWDYNGGTTLDVYNATGTNEAVTIKVTLTLKAPLVVDKIDQATFSIGITANAVQPA